MNLKLIIILSNILLFCLTGKAQGIQPATFNPNEVVIDASDLQNTSIQENFNTLTTSQLNQNTAQTSSETSIKMIVMENTTLTIAGAFFDSSNTIVKGQLVMNNGGEIVGNAPVYSNTSQLIYNTSGLFERGKEWSSIGVGTTYTTSGTPGYPYDVILQNNSNIVLSGSLPNEPRAIANNLTINNGSALNMASNTAMTQPLTIIGNLESAGNLILSTADNGDLITYGNLNFTNGFNFNANGKKIYFNKIGTQKITAPSDLTIPYLHQNPATGQNTVELNTNILATASNQGTAIHTGNNNNIIDLNGFHLTIGTNALSNIVEGNGSFKGGTATTTSQLSLLGNGSIGTLNFLPSYNHLNTFSINRQAATKAATLGTDLIVNELTLTNGHIDTDSKKLIIKDAGFINGGSSNSYVITDLDKNGYLQKNYPTALTSNQSFTFPIGKEVNQYTPATIHFKTTDFNANAYAALTVQNLKYSENTATTNYINRYWKLTAKNIENPVYDFQGNYLQSDVVGNETALISGQFNSISGIWTEGLQANSSSNYITLNNLTSDVALNFGHSTIYTAGDQYSKFQIEVLGNNNLITNGSNYTSYLNHTQFENTPLLTTTTRTFTIRNAGSSSLNILNISLNASTTFSLEPLVLPTTLNSGETITFQIHFTPTSTVPEMATVSIESNDPNNNPFTFNIGSIGTSHSECTFETIEKIIATQNFEDSPQTNALPYILGSGSSQTNGNAFAVSGDAGNSNKFIDNKSIQITNSSSEITFHSINTLELDKPNFSIQLGAFATASHEGMDSNDAISVAISTDGGNTFSKEISINGFQKAKWSFNNGNANAEIDFDGNDIIEPYKNFLLNEGNYLTTDGYGKIIINNLPKSNNIQIKILATANNNSIWAFDNAVLKGHKKVTRFWNGSSWLDQNGITAAAPTINQKVVINANYNSDTNGGTVNACECLIASGVSVVMKQDHTLNVHNNLNIVGQLDIKNAGSLVQHNDYAINSGELLMERITPPIFRYDYVYWSSPLTLDSNYKLHTVSPNTLSSKFHLYNATTGSWSNLNAPTTNMVPGVGYIVRGPSNLNNIIPSTVFPHTAIFEGKPSNGIVNTPIIKNDTNDWNLIGNPYASAIDAEKFLLKNQNHTTGAVYIWSHSTGMRPNVVATEDIYTATDYVTYNLTGTANNASGLDDFPGNIAAGQSFFVQATNSGTITFNNDMRLIGNNRLFYRPANHTEPNENANLVGKHRIWLNLTKDNANFNQALIGYVQNATNQLDWGYDAEALSGTSVSLYTVLDQTKLTIQGRALPFNNQDRIPLGYKTTLTGNHKISLDKIDGLFTAQNIYLEDLSLNITHNLKLADYTFASNPGDFSSRFVVKFWNDEHLDIDNIKEEQSIAYAFKNNNDLTIKAKNATIDTVSVYDLLGRLIIKKSKINSNTVNFPDIVTNTQTLLVKIGLENGTITYKKVIF